ncbi:MAG: DUF1080 domain-containing protein [Planctomycetia bacterium]|nr:DUF1080 domain-containing protein [Planctomycetia bacterium]
MKKSLCLLAALLATVACFACNPSNAQEAEEGFVSIFDGNSLDGWTVHGGQAKYKVDDGCIVGECVPNTPGNTFLVYEKTYGNFILKLDFKVDVPGNSGVQFRSAIRKDDDRVFGYQCEIAPGDRDTCRIYDEGRRGHQKGRVWLDATADEVLDASIATYKADDWNSLEIQAIGPSLRTWLNGVPVVNIFDYYDFEGVFGLQIHQGNQGTIRWKNIRVKDLGVSKWHSFFVKGDDGWDIVDAYKFVPECWSFTDDGVLIGQHDDTEKRDGLIVSNEPYDDFAAKVDYVFKGGVNSALYFRAHEVDTPWLLRGCQDEIAGNGKEAAIWHTAGKNEPGRGWLAADDEFVETIRNKGEEDWNQIAVCACGDRAVTFLNGFRVVDITDPLLEKEGKVGLQLHGGSQGSMWFKNFQIMPITKEQRALIER